MPSKPTWFHRLPEICDVLTRMDSSHRDRQRAEKLFGGGARRARQWMAGIRVGNAAAISRGALIERMEETAGSQLITDCAFAEAARCLASPQLFRVATTASLVLMYRVMYIKGCNDE